MKYMLKVITILLISAYPVSAQVTGLSGWNIFLDPGHSRTENMGIFGYSEAERNVRVGLRLREMLLNTTDIDAVYMSRTNDQEYVSLSQRTDYANSLGAAWFHSIHSDASSNAATNKTLLLWGQYFNGDEKVPNGGKAMSDIMVDILSRGMRIPTSGSIGDCSFYGTCSESWQGPYLSVNRRSNMPSELSESGFHTNPTQNQLFMNAEWKKFEAKTFFWSILKFHGIERPYVGTCIGIISDQENGIPINGAQVTLGEQTYTTDTHESLFYKYSSDPDRLHNGFYYFEDLPDSTLRMLVEAEDFYSDTFQVAIVDTFFTFKDVALISKKPPYVVSTTPAQGDTNFPAWDDIIFDFSRKMNKASVESTFVSTPVVDGRFAWFNLDTRVIFRPDSLDFETNYSFTISGNAKDVYDHPFDGNADGNGGDDFTLSFKTGPSDMVAPKISSIYPPSGASNVELLPLVNIAYDELLDTASITEDIVALEKFSGHVEVPGILKHYVVKNRSVLCFFPEEELLPNVSYLTKILPGLKDISGNEVVSQRGYRFRTTDKFYDFTEIDNFESNMTDNWWQPQSSGSTTGTIPDSTNRAVNSNIINHLSGSSKSMQLKYGWEPSATSWLIREYLSGGAPRNVHFDNSYTLQVYVFGDGSGNQFRFCVDDNVPAGGYHEVSPWYTIDWLVWKLISWDMTKEGTGKWTGNGT